MLIYAASMEQVAGNNVAETRDLEVERIAGALVTAVRQSVRENMDSPRSVGGSESVRHGLNSSEDNRRPTEESRTPYERAIMLQNTMRRAGDLSRQANPGTG